MKPWSPIIAFTVIQYFIYGKIIWPPLPVNIVKGLYDGKSPSWLCRNLPEKYFRLLPLTNSRACCIRKITTRKKPWENVSYYRIQTKITHQLSVDVASSFLAAKRIWHCFTASCSLVAKVCRTLSWSSVIVLERKITDC